MCAAREGAPLGASGRESISALREQGGHLLELAAELALYAAEEEPEGDSQLCWHAFQDARAYYQRLEEWLDAHPDGFLGELTGSEYPQRLRQRWRAEAAGLVIRALSLAIKTHFNNGYFQLSKQEGQQLEEMREWAWTHGPLDAHATRQALRACFQADVLLSELASSHWRWRRAQKLRARARRLSHYSWLDSGLSRSPGQPYRESCRALLPLWKSLPRKGALGPIFPDPAARFVASRPSFS